MKSNYSNLWTCLLHAFLSCGQCLSWSPLGNSWNSPFQYHKDLLMFSERLDSDSQPKVPTFSTWVLSTLQSFISHPGSDIAECVLKVTTSIYNLIPGFVAQRVCPQTCPLRVKLLASHKPPALAYPHWKRGKAGQTLPLTALFSPVRTQNLVPEARVLFPVSLASLHILLALSPKYLPGL